MRALVVMLMFSSVASADELVVTPKETFKTVAQHWKKHCSMCHDSDGNSTKIGAKRGSPDNVYTASEDKTVEEIFKIVSEGKNKMPGFSKKLTREEILKIAQHIEFAALVDKVMRKRERLERELLRIKTEYKNLPECNEVVW